MLLDESFGELGDASFAASPIKPSRQPLARRLRQDEPPAVSRRPIHRDDEPIKPRAESADERRSPSPPSPGGEDERGNEPESSVSAPGDASVSEDQDTIIISKPAPAPSPPKPTTPPPNPALAPQTPGTAKRLKVRVNADVERIMVRTGCFSTLCARLISIQGQSMADGRRHYHAQSPLPHWARFYWQREVAEREGHHVYTSFLTVTTR